MGYLRTMGAGCAGSTVRYKGVNVNQIQFGDKLQGLPPLTGTRRPHRIYKRKAGGQKPGRDTIPMGLRNVAIARTIDITDIIGPITRAKVRHIQLLVDL
jgi:hypothetical protein